MTKIIILTLALLTCLPAFAADKKETAFDRIIRTGVIRCGYYVFPPATYRDPNTDKLSGFSVDMMDEIARRGGLKIEWTEETNFNNWILGLQSQRYDVACTPNWPDVSQARAVVFSNPMLYAGLYPMVRADDKRFQKNDIKRLNAADVTFSVVEGDGFSDLIKAKFPLAKVEVLSADTANTTFMMNVVTKKSDAFLTDHNAGIEFNKNNPVKLKLLDADDPVKLQAYNLAVEKDEIALNNFLNTAISELINDGTMDRLLRKWEPEPGKTYLRVSKPYDGSTN